MVRKYLSLFILLALSVGLALAAAGCRWQETDSSKNPSPKKAPPDKVTFQLHWMREEPVYWAAVEKGFWAEQNLEVEIVRGTGSVDAVTKVANKRADFGRADVGTVILAQANEGARIKVISGYHANYPSVMLFRQSSGIKHPKDLEGRKLSGTVSSTMWVFWPLFAQSAGIDQNKVEWKLVDPSLTRALFINGEVDAFPVSIYNVPQIEKTAGEPLGFFLYKDYGLSGRYGEVIFTHEDIIAQNPDLVRRFVAGYLKAYRYMLEHPEETEEIVKKHAPEIETNLMNKSWQLEIDNGILVDKEERENGLGWISAEKMAQTIQSISKAYTLKNNIAPEAVFTNEFLPREPIYPPQD